MPRVPKAPKPIDPLKAPPIAVCDAICRRFLKLNQNIDWKWNMATFHTLWKQYPSRPFWEGLELPFGGGEHALNFMNWFNSVEGKAHLERSWLLFNYNPPQPEVSPQPLSTLDNGGQVDDHVGDANNMVPPPPVLPARAKTVSEMMKS